LPIPHSSHVTDRFIIGIPIVVLNPSSLNPFTVQLIVATIAQESKVLVNHIVMVSVNMMNNLASSILAAIAL
jgi:hypothetical protein